MDLKNSTLSEVIITRLIQFAGYLSILFVTLIFLFLIKEGTPTLVEVPLDTLAGTRWYPIEELFGILPLFFGSITVTIGAAIVAVPLGIGTAVFLAEIAPSWASHLLKPLIEMLAGIPSVVLGFVGILVLSPFLRDFFNLPTGLTALAGSLLLGWSAIPAIASIAEDALNAVPTRYRDASLALGATKWQTIWRVTFPAGRSGILTAIMLGIGRIIGETMTVMMVSGNAPMMPQGLRSLFLPVRTMTATIASEMGEVAVGSTHYNVLFLVGMILFIISLIINIISFTLSARTIKRSERLLS